METASRGRRGQPARLVAAGEMPGRIEAFFVRHSERRFNLWQGGTTKSNSGRAWLWRDAWGADWQPTF